MSGINPHYIKGFPFDDSLDEEEEKYIYLAWLYANELICYDMGMAFPVEGVDLELYKYSINHPELGSMGMEFTIKEYNIPETEILL
jgi:hypothetical protein